MYSTGQYDYQILQAVQAMSNKLTSIVDWLNAFKLTFDAFVAWIQTQLPLLAYCIILFLGVQIVLQLFFPSGGLKS